MALYADRVKQSLGVTGTGTITLTLATTGNGYQSFLTAFGTGTQTVAYCIADQTGPNWEVGTGSYNGSANTLARTTVLASSNGGLLTNFSGGTQDVFCTAPAKYLDTFTDTNQGVVPASGGDTSTFLRADGTFAAPPGGTPASPTTSVQFNNAGAFGGVSTFTYASGTDTLSVGKLVSANFTSAAQGLVPASGGGTTNFLRADGTFTAPPTTAPAGATTQIQFNNASAFGASANFTYATATNTFTVGPAGATTTIETLAPTGSTTAGILRIRGKNASATNGNGGAISLLGGNGAGTGVGGDINLTTGDRGGRVAVLTGTASSSSGAGGDFDVQLGNGGTSGSGGNFFVNSGVAGQDFGGTFYVLGGGGGIGGSFAMGCGASTTGAGGDVTFYMGGGATDDGNIYIQEGLGRNFIHCRNETAGGGPLQIGFFNVTPVNQPTTATTAATRVAVVGTLANIGDTYDGYTLAKVVRALRDLGILA
jgi:hypothetical protein